MANYLFIGKALSKGTAASKGTSKIVDAASKGIHVTKTLADGTKITSSAVKLTKKVLKGNGEVGAKGVGILKAKLKDVKSMLKKKVKKKTSSSEGLEAYGEGFLTKSDVYDNVFFSYGKEINKPTTYRVLLKNENVVSKTAETLQKASVTKAEVYYEGGRTFVRNSTGQFIEIVQKSTKLTPGLTKNTFGI